MSDNSETISDSQYEAAKKLIEKKDKQDHQIYEKIHEEKMKNLVGKFFEENRSIEGQIVVLRFLHRNFSSVTYEQWSFYNEKSYGCCLAQAYDNPSNCKEITSIEYYQKVQQILALIGVKPQ